MLSMNWVSEGANDLLSGGKLIKTVPLWSVLIKILCYLLKTVNLLP